MDLRDRFAAHFAAALVDALADPGQIAERAYDLAEAMLAERARRVDHEERSAIAYEPAPPTALLEEPGYEDDLDPSWMEPPYDPSWDLETRWSERPSRPPSDARPGLARTMPGATNDEGRKERLA